MAVSGAVGLPAILKLDACIHDGFVGFRNLDDKISPTFLAYLLMTLRISSKSQATGAIWKNLTTDQIKAWKIILPPQALQRKFEQEEMYFCRLYEKQMESDGQIEQLFQSLLHRTFQGEL